MSFATAEQLLEQLGIPADGDRTARAKRLVNQATTLIKAEIDQDLDEATDTVTLDGEGRRVLLLAQIPVTAVVSVVEDGTALTVDDYTWSAAGLLTRVGTWWPTEPRSVVVEYTHGYAADAPELEPLRELCLAVAARHWGNPEQASGKQYGDRQVSWSTGPMELTEFEIRICDRFRG